MGHARFDEALQPMPKQFIFIQVLNTGLDVSDKISLILGALEKGAARCAGRAEQLDDVELARIWEKLEATYDNNYQQVMWPCSCEKVPEF